MAQRPGYSRDQVLSDLREHVVEVTFTKVNGQQRVMRCTLMQEHLPPSYRESLDEQRQEEEFHQANKDTLAVWDIQNGGWRSFRIDSVTYLQIIDGY